MERPWVISLQLRGMESKLDGSLLSLQCHSGEGAGPGWGVCRFVRVKVEILEEISMVLTSK